MSDACALRTVIARDYNAYGADVIIKVLDAIDDDFTNGLLRFGKTVVAFEVTRFELSRLETSLAERDGIRMRHRALPPANMRMNSKCFDAAQPYAPKGDVISMLTMMSEELAIADEEAEKCAEDSANTDDHSALCPLDHARLNRLLLRKAASWNTCLTVFVPIRALEARITTASRQSSTRLLLERDRRAAFLDQLINVAIISKARRSVNKPDPLVNPASATTSRREIAAGVVGEGGGVDNGKIGYSLWLATQDAVGRLELRQIEPLLPLSLLRARDVLSAMFEYRLHRCVLTWRKTPDDKKTPRRCTVILARQWLVRAMTTTRDSESFKGAIGKALQMVDKARALRPLTPELESSVIFLRHVWRDSRKPLHGDDVVLADLKHVFALRAQAMERRKTLKGCDGWKNFRKEVDYPRRLDLHDWWINPW